MKSWATWPRTTPGEPRFDHIERHRPSKSPAQWASRLQERRRQRQSFKGWALGEWFLKVARRFGKINQDNEKEHTHTHTHLETPRRETMKWDEMKIHVSSCWVFGFAQLPYWDYCRYTRLIRPCIPLQGIASLHWVCQGVPNAPARWYTNSKRTIETHVLHAWRCTDVSDWNLYATWTSSR